MSDKKKPGRFTIQFNDRDPQHRLVIDLLNQQGRNKAQFLTNAVLHYINCSEVPEPRPSIPDGELLEKMVLEILARHSGKPAVEDAQGPIRETRISPDEARMPSDAEQWFGGKDGVAAILNSLEIFGQK